MAPLTLAQRVLAIEGALPTIPHAFGGALALAYYAEPRATIDIDLNVFVPVDRYPDVAAPSWPRGAATSGYLSTGTNTFRSMSMVARDVAAPLGQLGAAT